MSLSRLTSAEIALLEVERRAVLATLRPDGRPRLVPITYAVDVAAGVLYSPLDEKPKTVADPRRLARVRDIAARSAVSVLVDHWDEDWRRLAWLRLDGSAMLVEPGSGSGEGEHAAAIGMLRARYGQYAAPRLADRPLLRIAIEQARSWSAR